MRKVSRSKATAQGKSLFRPNKGKESFPGLIFFLAGIP